MGFRWVIAKFWKLFFKEASRCRKYWYRWDGRKCWFFKRYVVLLLSFFACGMSHKIIVVSWGHHGQWKSHSTFYFISLLLSSLWVSQGASGKVRVEHKLLIIQAVSSKIYKRVKEVHLSFMVSPLKWEFAPS